MQRTRFFAFCLALFCLFSLSACKGNTESSSATPSPSAEQTPVQPFGTEDLTVSGFTIGQTTFEDAQQALGDGFEEDSYTLGVDKSQWKSLMSDAVTYAFMERDGQFILSHINIMDASVTAPRDTKVGDSAQSVLAKFPHQESFSIDDGTTVFYRANASDQTEICVPPCGLRTETQISYYAPSAPYAFDVNDASAVQSFDLSTDVNYALFYEITDGTVSAIYLRYGADQDTAE